MKIQVVCGAGASSTFVASRLRTAAQQQGRDWQISAASAAAIDSTCDVILVGPHLASEAEPIRSLAPAARVVILPEDAFTDLEGTRVLALVLETSEPQNSHPRERTDMTAASRTVRIASSHGLHARPAKLFAQAAKDAGIPVTITKDAGKAVNATSILGVIALGLEQGDYVTLNAEGDNAEDVLDTLVELLATDHDESSAE